MTISNLTSPDAVTLTPPVSLWRNRDFLLLWVGQALSSVGTEAATLAFPLLVLAVTGSPAQAGLAGAAAALPDLVLVLPMGVLVDRVDRRRLMLACDAARTVNVVVLVLALALHHLWLPYLYLFALIDGACAVTFRLAHIVCLPRIVAREQLPDAVARRETTEGLVTLLGPSLGGALFTASRALPFLADAVSYAASLISLLLIRTPFQTERTASRRHIGVEMREGVTWLWRQPLVRFMAFVYGGFGLLFYAGSLCTIVLAQERGASPLMIGLLFAMGGIGGIIGAIIAPWVRARVRFGRLIPLLHWGYTLLWPLYVLAPTPLLMGVVEAFFLANDQIYDVTWPSYRMALIPDQLQGRVTGAARLAPSVCKPIGLALVGVLIQRFGAAPVMLAYAVPLALLSLIVTLSPVVRNAPELTKEV